MFVCYRLLAWFRADRSQGRRVARLPTTNKMVDLPTASNQPALIFNLGKNIVNLGSGLPINIGDMLSNTTLL